MKKAKPLGWGDGFKPSDPLPKQALDTLDWLNRKDQTIERLERETDPRFAPPPPPFCPRCAKGPIKPRLVFMELDGMAFWCCQLGGCIDGVRTWSECEYRVQPGEEIK